MKWMMHGRRLPGYYPRILSIVLCLLLLGLTYYYNRIALPKMLVAQEEELMRSLDLERMEHRTVLILKPGQTLEKGVAIGKEELEMFEAKDWPVPFLPDHVLQEAMLLLGMVTERAMVGGEVLVPESFSFPDTRLEGYHRLIGLPLRDNLLGRLQPGKYIDLLAFWPDGSYEVMVSKTPLMEVLEEEDQVWVLLPVDDYEHRLIEKVRVEAVFGARLYLDSTQPASSLLEAPDPGVYP